MHALTDAFLLGFPALLSIVNPLSGAFIFRDVTANVDEAERIHLARLIGLYSFATMLCAIWLGSWILAFFGITLSALRIGGGVVVALNAWSLLNTPEQREARKQQDAPSTHEDMPFDAIRALAFFPLTMPITTGPGTIAVSITLGSAHPETLGDAGLYLLGLSLGAAGVAALVWIAYRFADPLVRQFGQTGSRVISRLAAFLLLCIGVQILISGVQGVLAPLMTATHGG